ncbi:MAG: hypothetical protein ACREEM_08895 [Blastocatellia bacterium]
MSKKKAGRKVAGQKEKVSDRRVGTGRRNFILLGAGALAATGAGLAGAYNAGWFDSEPAASTTTQGKPGKNLTPVQLPADSANALRAANEMLEHYARDIGNASVLIHAVRGFNRNFMLADGTKAVDHLCSRYAAEKEVNGKRYVHFKRDAEVHENSFLKTFLEAGVGQDQAVTVGANRYTVRDVAGSAKSLFRCDPKDLYRFDAEGFRYDPTPQPPRRGPEGEAIDLKGELVHEHLPWGLIAFSNLIPPGQASWTNTYNEPINLPAVIDRALAEYESTCALGEQALAGGQPAPEVFRKEIKKYSCFGLHSAYGFLACLKHGYQSNDLAARVTRMMDLLTYRLKGDAEAINREYAAQAQGAPPQVVEAFRVRALVKLYGHAFESINYAKLHNLVKFTPAQDRRIQAGEQAFYESLVRLRALDWGVPRRMLGDKFVSDIVIALGHAARALKLLTPQNPDVVA